MKYAIGVMWLAAAYFVGSSPSGRRIFAYLGAMVALAHAGALVGGLISQRLARRSIEGGVSLTGFLIGLCLGVLVGAAIGSLVSRNSTLFWITQIAAAAFIMFLPLFRI